MSFPILRIVVDCSIVSTQEYRSRVYEDISGTAAFENSFHLESKIPYGTSTQNNMTEWTI